MCPPMPTLGYATKLYVFNINWCTQACISKLVHIFVSAVFYNINYEFTKNEWFLIVDLIICTTLLVSDGGQLHRTLALQHMDSSTTYVCTCTTTPRLHMTFRVFDIYTPSAP